MAEETIYSDKNVSITTARVAMGATTYALRNITSVQTVATPPKGGCATVFLGVGILGVALGIIEIFLDVWSAITALIVSGFFLGVWAVWRRFLKTRYHVVISSASGEVRALTSTDKTYIDRIVVSVNEAIARYR